MGIYRHAGHRYRQDRLYETETERTPRANTAHVKEYIDFASKHGFDAVLVEGWNEGWEDNYAYSKEFIYDFDKPYPDFRCSRTATLCPGERRENHHAPRNHLIGSRYERQMHDAFRFMNKYGYDAVKTGYVGGIIPRSEHHDGQWMVNHYLPRGENGCTI